jgi:uncharacterized repeat protein (TIGR03803 family)
MTVTPTTHVVGQFFGGQYVQVTVTAKDANGQALSGINIDPTVTGNALVFASNQQQILAGDSVGTTDVNGQLTFFVSDTTAEAGTVTVSLGGSATYSTAVTFVPDAPSPTTSSLTASPVTFANGIEQTNLTIVDRDQFGNARAGDAVSLSSTGGGADTFSPASGAKTNASGVLGDVLTSTSGTSETVTATFDGLSKTVNVAFAPLDVWVNPAGGTWNDAANAGNNWSNGIPTANSAVWIGVTGTYTVNLTAAEAIYALSTRATATLNLTNALTVTGTGDSVVAGGLTIGNGGALFAQNGKVELNGAVTNNAFLDAQSGSVINVAGAITGTGTIIADGGTLNATAAVAATQSISLGNAGTAHLAQTFGGSVTFSGAGTLVLDAAPAAGLTVHNFGIGDAIDLTNLTYSANATLSWDQASETLTVTSGGASESFLYDAQSLSGVTHLGLAQLGSGGTAIVYNAPVLTTLYSFNAANEGGAPQNSVITDAEGNVYGEIGGPASGSAGGVFKLVNTGTAANPHYTGINGLANFILAGPLDGVPVGLVTDANGNLFGVNAGSPQVNNLLGAIFEIKNSGTVAAPNYTSPPIALVTFSGGVNGYDPKGGLLVDAKGDLFGTDTVGGPGSGVVFEMVNNGTLTNPSYTFHVLAGFGTAFLNGIPVDESDSHAPMIIDANGNLFGTSSNDGQVPAVFEVQNTGTAANPVYANSVSVLWVFGLNGRAGGLVADAKGDLFGTTEDSNNGDGQIFEMVNTGSVAAPVYGNPVTLVNFQNPGPETPEGTLIIDANGDLFGVTSNGVQTVYELVNNGTVANPNYASTPITLATFTGANGAEPLAGLYADANGNLFGTTFHGGAHDSGTVFEITHSGFVVHDPATIADGGSFEITSASDDDIIFAGPTGTLQLDQSQGFVGRISGFGGQDHVDLRDIAFSANTTLHYTQNNGNSLGVLTVSDGTHAANIVFEGQYTSFTAASDGHGGTLITDPPAGQPATIAAGELLDIGSADDATITFADSTGMLKLEAPASFTGIIKGFASDAAHSDSVDLSGFDAASTVFTQESVNGNLVVTATEGDKVATLTFDHVDGALNFANDGFGGTVITNSAVTSGPEIGTVDATVTEAGVHGTITAADPGASGALTTSVQAEGANYVGAFSVHAAVAANGIASVEYNFEFNPDSAPAQAVTQSYDVAVKEGATTVLHQTVSVSVGTANADNFVFSAGVGADTIVNFDLQHDTIDLSHFENIQSVQQLASQTTTNAHGDAVIDLGNHDSITIAGVTAAQLQQVMQSVVHLH